MVRCRKRNPHDPCELSMSRSIVRPLEYAKGLVHRLCLRNVGIAKVRGEDDATADGLSLCPALEAAPLRREIFLRDLGIRRRCHSCLISQCSLDPSDLRKGGRFFLPRKVLTSKVLL